MKRTLTTTLTTVAVLSALTGSALSMAQIDNSHADNHSESHSDNQVEGFVFEKAAHPHDHDSNTTTHNSWTQTVSDGTHVYKLTMHGDDYTVIVDGKEIPKSQINKEGTTFIVSNADGEVIHTFENYKNAQTPTTPWKVNAFPSGAVGAIGGAGVSGRNFEIVINTDDEDGFAHQALVTGVQSKPKVMLGIYSGEPSESLREQLGIENDALLVERVIKGLSADKAGIKDHDIIISIDGSKGMTSSDLTKLLTKHTPGDEIKVVVIRNGKEIKLATKLLAYDAGALGHSFPSGGATSIWNNDGNLPGRIITDSDTNSFFSRSAGSKAHESILKALRENGIDEDQIKAIEKQIQESLGANAWSLFSDDGQGDIVEFDMDNQTNDARRVIVERRFAENMQRKAEQAAREVERMTMEYRDGQLLLKRQSKGLEDQLSKLQGMVDSAMPEIEEEFEDRIEVLEERFERLEDALEERMDSLSSLIERLIDRLDDN
ncbi:MAG: PDZ domain-containing protein [Phycisphaerales bacterium]